MANGSDNGGLLNKTTITQAGGIVVALALIYYVSQKIDNHERSTTKSSEASIEKIEKNTAALADVAEALKDLTATLRLQSRSITPTVVIPAPLRP